MKSGGESQATANSRTVAEASRKRWLGILVAGTLGLVLLAGLMISNKAPNQSAISPPEAVEASTPPATETGNLGQRSVNHGYAAVAEGVRTTQDRLGQPERPMTAMPEPTASSRALVGEIVNVVPTEKGFSQEQAGQWRASLQRLIDNGAESVPAIAEFLAKNTDFSFEPGGAQVLGFSTARGAILHALTEIGGNEAVTVLQDTLRTAADPHEIAILADKLERLEPGQHRQESLVAVREALEMARQKQLTGRDVAPLFEVLQRYGDAAIVPELEQYAKNWGYYSVVALAQLPEGAGVSSLLQIATGEKWSSGARDAAWQMVAQLASQSPEAQAVLLEQVRQNKLSAYNWASISTLLGGDQLQFKNSSLNPSPGVKVSASTSAGEQRLIAVPAGDGLTVERINQQIALIDELMQATADATATRALQQARAVALRRLSQVSAGTPGQGIPDSP